MRGQCLNTNFPNYASKISLEQGLACTYKGIKEQIKNCVLPGKRLTIASR